jgi:NAD-dependent deacetylase
VASIYAFRQNPKAFYDWIKPLARLLVEAEPNAAHLVLAQLERQGKLKAVVTQNIDYLHQKAGSQIVYELHGHLREVTCLQCYEVQDSTDIILKFLKDGQVPQHYCGGVLKPNVVLFGEEPPMQEFISAQLALEQADLVIVIGSSLEVAPAADLPNTALNNGAKLIIINYQPTYLDPKADVVIRGDVANILPEIIDLVSF